MPKKQKAKKPTRSKLIQKADTVFSTYIRLRDSDKHGIVTCPLCGATLPRKKAQNMHFITRACMLFRYDEINCHAGCMRCNVILNGNYIIYTRYMQNTYGINTVDDMIKKSKMVWKLSTPDIQAIINEYTNKIIRFSKRLAL